MNFLQYKPSFLDDIMDQTLLEVMEEHQWVRMHFIT